MARAAVTKQISVGTAGWAIPRAHAGGFPSKENGQSTLARYAETFSVVEINSTFYRRHRASTFLRWKEAVPAGFRFSLKLSRSITHEAELAAPRALLREFFADAEPLGPALGAVLVQLAGSHPYDARRARAFFRTLRAIYDGPVAFEPRNPSWYEPGPSELLAEARVSRVLADPPKPAAATAAGGDPSFLYLRLHGSPRMYYSAYGPERLEDIASRLKTSPAREAWCIFDNTASGAAAGNALELRERLEPAGKR